MKAKLIKQKKLLIPLTVILLLGTLLIYILGINYIKYNNPDFKAYVEHRRYCGSFWGGENASKDEMYKDWKNHSGPGC